MAEVTQICRGSGGMISVRLGLVKLNAIDDVVPHYTLPHATPPHTHTHKHTLSKRLQAAQTAKGVEMQEVV
jgi:hypothetical protein